MRPTILAVSGLVFTAGLVFWVLLYDPDSSASGHFDVERRVFWTLVAENTGSRALHDVKILSFAPIGQRWNQRLDQVDSTFPFELVKHENRPFVRLDIGTIPPLGQREIRIDATLALASSAAHLKKPAVSDVRDRSPLIESDHPDIRALARRLRRSTPLESARAIHAWLERTMSRSQYDGIDRGALHALRSRGGDCTEYAALTVALARAMNIPARLIAGYVAAENRRLAFYDYHAWAEVRLDNRWLIVDTHRGFFDASPSQYIATSIGFESADAPAFTRFYTPGPDLKLSMK